MMTQIRISILAAALLTLAATASAIAEEPAPPKTEGKPVAVLATKMEDISNWSKKQWYAAKAKWVKEKVKWADCQMQTVDKKLSGRKSWPFLYSCMTQ
jgi:hypothetical protein